MSKQRTLSNHVVFNPLSTTQLNYKKDILEGNLGSYKCLDFDVKEILRYYPRYFIRKEEK